MRDIRFLLKPHYENSRALIVGIDNYKNASPLSYAVSDASEVRDVLVNEFGSPRENVVYLTEAEATKENILRSFMISETSEDHFPVKEAFSPDQFIERIAKYEDSVFDLSSLLACVSYWAKPNHRQILQKALSRSTDRLVSEDGNVPWVNLRWYPIILLFYCSGIAAVEGERYDSLADIFYAKVPPLDYFQKEIYLIASAARRASGVEDIFKLLPGHERQYVPLSEYLYKILQPKLDDILFISKNYERAFDVFEVLFALAAVDLRKQSQGLSSIPLGRFGWKHGNLDNGPYKRIIHEAQTAGETWKPIKSGLFGGSLQRFNDAASDLENMLAKLRWF